MSMAVIDRLIESLLRGVAEVLNLIQRTPKSVLAIAAWGLLGMMVWQVWSGMRDTVKRSRRMHEIPCPDCQFFTNDHRLKCTVHPNKAMTEEAIGCIDFEKKEG